MDILKNENTPVEFKQSIASSPRISQEHADYIMNGDNAKLKRTVLTYNPEYVRPEHIDNIMQGDNLYLKNSVLLNNDDLVLPHHIKHILAQPAPPQDDELNSLRHASMINTIKTYYPHLLPKT